MEDFGGWLFDWLMGKLSEVKGQVWEDLYKYLKEHVVTEWWNLLPYPKGFTLSWIKRAYHPKMPKTISDLIQNVTEVDEESIITIYVFSSNRNDTVHISWGVRHASGDSLIEAAQIFAQGTDEYADVAGAIDRVQHYVDNHYPASVATGTAIPVKGGQA